MEYTEFAAGIIEKEVAFFLTIYDEIMQHIEGRAKEKVTVSSAKNYCGMLENLNRNSLELCYTAEKYVAHGHEIKQMGKLRLTVQSCGIMAPFAAQMRANILAFESGFTSSLDDVMNELRGE